MIKVHIFTQTSSMYVCVGVWWWYVGMSSVSLKRKQLEMCIKYHCNDKSNCIQSLRPPLSEFWYHVILWSYRIINIQYTRQVTRHILMIYSYPSCYIRWQMSNCWLDPSWKPRHSRYSQMSEHVGCLIFDFILGDDRNWLLSVGPWPITIINEQALYRTEWKWWCYCLRGLL